MSETRRAASAAFAAVALSAAIASCRESTPPAGTGAPIALRIAAAPGASFTDMPVALRVEVVDQHGNVAAQSTHAISVALGANPAGASLGGTLTQSTQAGSVTFADLTVSKPGGGYALAISAEGLSGVTTEPFTVTGMGRSLVDRPDDVAAEQVHAVYVLPSDGADRYFDLNGAVAQSVAAFRSWFQQTSGGLAYRFDTFGGELDVTFFRMAQSDATIQQAGAGVLFRIADEMRAAGLLSGNKLYVAYYDGGSTYACGGAAWPPNVPGQVAAMYLKGQPNGGSCPSSLPTIGTSGFPGYWEFAMLHDLTHTLGIVSTAAPHHTVLYPAHVPEQTDLMYTGPGPWILNATTVIDVGGDDYHGSAVAASLPQLAKSPFVFATLARRLPPVPAPSAFEEALLAAQMKALPVHEPLVPKPR